MAAILINPLRQQWPFAIETGLVLLGFFIAFSKPDFARRAYEHTERLSGRLRRSVDWQ